ncbi:reverse transcriptase domain-containing protein [Tanacetum coccineum]|uniref:Reverse transcriptase domain-containing protein n=1 Tax=Tanacetum coccineum TaxID=301880 RepID=A0ABQ5HMP9_9ASTR
METVILLDLIILPSVSPFPPTIKRITRISILPIEPNLAERARISAFNLDDYQFDPLTPPPSPSSPFTMAAYQWMISETNPTQRGSSNRNWSEFGASFNVTVGCEPEVRKSLETLSMDELITQLRQMCEDAKDRASNTQEEARQKRKEALEEVKTPPGRRPTVNRNPPVNRSTNRNNVDINSGIDTQMLNQLIATRVTEALAAAAVTHAASTQEETNRGSNSSQNKTCNYKEFRAVMHENFRGTEGAVGLTRWFEKLESQFGISNVAEGDRVKFASSTLLDGALTWWNVYVRSVTLDTAHATPWSDFKAMFIRKYCPRNEIKQMENELWNLKVKGTNLTAYNQRFQELILLCPEMVPNADRLLERYIEGLPLNIKGNVTSSKPVDLHEAIEMAQGLMYQVVQELGENSGDKRKWNRNHYTHNPNNTSNLNPNKRLEQKGVYRGQGSLCWQVPQYEKKMWTTPHCRSPPACYNGGKAGHKANDCRSSTIVPQPKEDPKSRWIWEAMSLFGCGEKGHYKNMDRLTSLELEVLTSSRNGLAGRTSTQEAKGAELKAKSRLEVISSIRTQKYIDQGCQVFLIQMMKEEKTEILERRIEDVPVLRDFPEVFLEDCQDYP